MKLRRIFSLLLAELLLFMAGTQAYATEAYSTVMTINLPGSDYGWLCRTICRRSKTGTTS